MMRGRGSPKSQKTFRGFAWGNHEIIDYTEFGLGQINPIRYRSYYYDTETGLYYLHSRYYDPEVGRFISMDDIDYLDPETIGGTNLYAYCNNNPVKYIDPSGNSFLVAALITAGILILGGGAIGGISAAVNGGTAADIWAGIGKGMVSGLIVSAGVLLAAGAFFVPGGVLGVLGLSMFSAGVDLVSGMLVIGITQGKKSMMDGDGFWQGANDVVNALFSNSLKAVAGGATIGSLTFYGSSIFSGVADISDFFSYVYELSRDWKYSTAFKIGMKEYWSQSAGAIGILTAGLGILFNGIDIYKAFTDNPNDSDYILY